MWYNYIFSKIILGLYLFISDYPEWNAHPEMVEKSEVYSIPSASLWVNREDKKTSFGDLLLSTPHLNNLCACSVMSDSLQPHGL